ncbi:hypothetical protein SAMN05421780_101104 [Flexibacter flexilis DSM 6793]|uniref:Uncharacterized protein n=1 Tax=Flexibacter flexilis DSM 6793 TaxID=927664 RepID=A0A1I1DD62_9BACT|nr:hypothetical protein [Flexibacter flexilis]SFB72306.1 hypothetical protein SAMN05421780_101104 [Flexibacter flexilis DSM 6793]
MNGKINIFFYYQFFGENKQKPLNVLLRCAKSFASRANQAEEDWADKQMELSRDVLLEQILMQTECSTYLLIGCTEISPEGDDLYAENCNGNPINFWYAETKYGNPWIVISQANTESEFMEILRNDEDMWRMEPINPQYISAIFYTK